MNDRFAPVLVTGAAGFAGGHLIEHLAGRADVTGWARSGPPAPLAALATWQPVDLLDRDRVRQAVRDLRPSRVFHCAGAAHVARSWQDPAEALAKNTLATHYLLDALRRADLRCRVLIPGSATVYAASTSPLHEESALAPASPYAISKLAQEQLGLRAGREDGVEVVLTRSFNHTGPRQDPAFAAPGMARQIAMIERGNLEPLITVGNLEAERELTDVRDTVRAYALIMEHGSPDAIYNVASGTGQTMRTVLDALRARARVPVRVQTDPALLRPNDTPVLVGDATRLRNATGWAPAISFDRMLDDLLDYWRQRVASGT